MRLLLLMLASVLLLSTLSTSTEGTGECLAPMEDGRWLMSDV